MKEIMTKNGFQKITDELRHLREVAIPEVAVEIDIATDMGDLKENAEYHAYIPNTNYTI